MVLTDSHNRTISYLRISVADRCNLRCVYCLPEIYDRFTPTGETLTEEELLSLVSCFAELGISKVRITGGEPLLRPGVERIVRGIARMEGISDISMSTNGVLLSQMAGKLAQAGLKRVNVSLDSLDPARFRKITRLGDIRQVRAGIEAAIAQGLSPVKINVVVARGMNEDEVGEFALWTQDQDVHVRFIELMPMGETGFFSKEKWVALDEIMERASPLEPLAARDWPKGHGPARYFKRPGARGTIGFISALSCGFCSSCNRVRLSARGELIPCLDDSQAVDLRTPLRRGAGIEEIKSLILDTVLHKKPERHFMLERATLPEETRPSPRYMCQVGG